MDISIGIMAYNEENNIGHILKALTDQSVKDVRIKEIIVVSDGSTDRTIQIVDHQKKKDNRIILISKKRRRGKAAVINDFLKAAIYNVLVLISADTLPERDAVEKLCAPLENPEIGIAGGHPMPLNTKGLLGKVIQLEYALHHRIALDSPKFGEMIAFRKVFGTIGSTAVDEEYIAMRIIRKGYKMAYAKNAIVRNKGPETIADFLRQRRRIYCGHLELAKRSGYKVATASNMGVLKEVLKMTNILNFPGVLAAATLESIARGLGFIDFVRGKKHYIWKIAKTTKKLR